MSILCFIELGLKSKMVRIEASRIIESLDFEKRGRRDDLASGFHYLEMRWNRVMSLYPSLS